MEQQLLLEMDGSAAVVGFALATGWEAWSGWTEARGTGSWDGHVGGGSRVTVMETWG